MNSLKFCYKLILGPIDSKSKSIKTALIWNRFIIWSEEFSFRNLLVLLLKQFISTPEA